MVGQANGLDADSGPAMADMTATAALSAAAAVEAGHLADHGRELQDKLVQQAATTAMWQARAEMLGHRLRALEAPREAPANAPESHEDANLTAQVPEPTREPPEPEPEPEPTPSPTPAPISRPVVRCRRSATTSMTHRRASAS
jgi:outer membrane biosynthesis protein TonB